MKRIVRRIQLQAEGMYPGLAPESGASGSPQHLDGYIIKQIYNAPRGVVRFWGYRMVVTSVSGEPEVVTTPSIRQLPHANHPRVLQLQPVGRFAHLTAPSNKLLDKSSVPSKGKVRDEENTTQQLAEAITLRPVQSGESYRITSPSARGLVRTKLAEALETVFERFARQHGFSARQPLEISLSRGFKANSHGHKEGRAADIDAVGGKGLLQWKQEWEQALTARDQPAEAIAAEQRRNLGYALYKALQEYGGWRVNPGGWRVYRNVMQLFGPWTATEGPWKAMRIENPTPKEHQSLADQQWVFRAHQDHIHVAS